MQFTFGDAQVSARPDCPSRRQTNPWPVTNPSSRTALVRHRQFALRRSHDSDERAFQLGDLGKRCKLLHWSLGWSPSRYRFWCILQRGKKLIWQQLLCGFLAYSIGMSLCSCEASVVRLSVCLSVCLPVCKLLHASRYFYHKHDSIATKLAHDGPHMVLHAGCAQGQGQGQRSRDTDTFLITRKSLLLPQTWLDRDQTCTRWSPHGLASRVCSRSRSRSKVTWYGHFSDVTKIASSTTNMTRSPPNLHTMVPRKARIQGVLKVKVTWYGHFCDVTKCLLYSTFWRSVSTCTHFTKHRYALLPVQVSGS